MRACVRAQPSILGARLAGALDEAYSALYAGAVYAATVSYGLDVVDIALKVDLDLHPLAALTHCGSLACDVRVGGDVAFFAALHAARQLPLSAMATSAVREGACLRLLLPAQEPVPSCLPAFAHPIVLPWPVAHSDAPHISVLALALPRLGPSLQSVHEQHALEPRTAYSLGARLLTALQAVHARGLVHADVKPDNFLLDQALPEGAAAAAQVIADATVVVIDFGLSLQASAEILQADADAAARASGGLPSEFRRSFYGTARYASRRALRKQPLSPRDGAAALHSARHWLPTDALPRSGERHLHRGGAGRGLSALGHRHCGGRPQLSHSLGAPQGDG